MTNRRVPARVSFLITLSFLLALPVELLQAATLEGSVVGAAGNRKPFVRVQIYGPTTMTTFTNNDGIFSAELAPGRYQIQVIESNRGAQFSVDMPANDTKKSQSFTLSW